MGARCCERCTESGAGAARRSGGYRAVPRGRAAENARGHHRRQCRADRCAQHDAHYRSQRVRAERARNTGGRRLRPVRAVLHSRCRPERQHVRFRAWRGHLRGRRLQRYFARLDVRSARPRSCRSVTWPAGHALWQELAGRLRETVLEEAGWRWRRFRRSNLRRFQPHRRARERQFHAGAGHAVCAPLRRLEAS